MSLQDFFIDVKNILLGKIGEENSVDLKQEIQNALKEGKIGKADAALLIQSINEVKADANEMDKKQLSSISLEDGAVVSFEEYEKKKSELERKKREKQKRVALESVQNQDIQTTVKESKAVNKSKKLNIDRAKMTRAMERDEKTEQNLNKAERDGKN